MKDQVTCEIDSVKPVMPMYDCQWTRSTATSYFCAADFGTIFVRKNPRAPDSYSAFIMFPSLFLYISSERLIFSRSPETHIPELDTELMELLTECLTTPSRSAEVSIYDTRVFELVKLKMVRIHEFRETSETSNQPRFRIELEDWIYRLLKEDAEGTLQTGRNRSK